MLHGVEDGEPPMLGRRVAVYGGGNTAMDAARTARRLGAAEAVVVYRRTRDRMPAHDIEVEEALKKASRCAGSPPSRTRTPARCRSRRCGSTTPGSRSRPASSRSCRRTAWSWRSARTPTWPSWTACRDVTFSDGTVDVGPDLMTGHPGIFAGGDMVPAERTVTVAIGHGKKAARAIDAWLRGVKHDAPRPGMTWPPYDRLNTWYYADAPATVRPKLEAARRTGTFDEVTGGLDASTALFEARRCMSCGNCFGCDNCYGACPDNAVIKTGRGHGYEIDYDYCKGCGICAAECPCGAISMVPEKT